MHLPGKALETFFSAEMDSGFAPGQVMLNQSLA